MALRFPQYPPTYEKIIKSDPVGFFEAHAKQARAGRVTSAHELLHGFCYFQERKQPVPAPIMNFLSAAFATYLTKTPHRIDKALRVVRPAHRPGRVYTVSPDKAVATLYLYMKRDGLKKDRAKEKTVGCLGLSKRRLEAHDRDLGHLIRDLSINELNSLAGS